MKKTKDNDQPSFDGTEEGEILQRLSEKVERAVSAIQELRRERDDLQKRLSDAEARLAESDAAAERAATLEDDCERYQRERGEIRTRIETILSSLESLEE